MGSSSPGVRAAAILILLFIKTVANRADSECQQEWLEKGIAWRYFCFPRLCLDLCLPRMNFTPSALSPSPPLFCLSVSLSLSFYLPSTYSILHGWVILNKINKNYDDLTNTAVMKRRSIRDRVCCGEILCRPAMDFSDKLISNAIKWTARCRTGIIYSRLKLIKFLLQKPPQSLFMACVFRFISFVWIPEDYRRCVNYCTASVVCVSDSDLKGRLLRNGAPDAKNKQNM